MSKEVEPAPKEEKPTEEIVKEVDNKFIVDKSILIVDSDTAEKYVTITVSSKMMHYIQEGLTAFREKFGEDIGPTGTKERDECEKLIDEFNQVKGVLTGEPVVKTKGFQEPNPVYDTEGTTEEPSPEEVTPK